MNVAQVPPPLQPLFDEYIAAIETKLPGFMAAFYLHGSLALDAFQPGLSDIDFITVINRPSTAQDLAQLRAIHQTLRQKYPTYPLSGSYLQWPDLGQSAATITPSPHYHEGTLHTHGRHDINDVTWWLLKHRGLALVGREPQELSYSVNWDALIADMKLNLNTYWLRFTRDPTRMVWLLFDEGIQWATLGVLRQFYTFQEQAITSKIGAGEYALKHLSPKWHLIIQEALNIRTQSHPPIRLYKSRLTRTSDALAFLKYIIHFCNTTFI